DGNTRRSLFSMGHNVANHRRGPTSRPSSSVSRPTVPLRSTPFSVFRLVGYQTAASTILRLSSAVLTVLIARAYGVTHYGAYATALALANLVALFPDWGMSLLIMRDGA